MAAGTVPPKDTSFQGMCWAYLSSPCYDSSCSHRAEIKIWYTETFEHRSSAQIRHRHLWGQQALNKLRYGSSGTSPPPFSRQGLSWLARNSKSRFCWLTRKLQGPPLLHECWDCKCTTRDGEMAQSSKAGPRTTKKCTARLDFFFFLGGQKGLM